MTFRRSFIAAIILPLTMIACSASTAHISSLQVGKDKDISTQSATFGPHDSIFAKGVASNVPSKITLQWHVIAEKVAGEPANETIKALDKSFDLASDGDSSYSISPPDHGWPAGTYKITLTMMDEGTQRDQKSQEFTVSGS